MYLHVKQLFTAKLFAIMMQVLCLILVLFMLLISAVLILIVQIRDINHTHMRPIQQAHFVYIVLLEG